VAPVLVSDLEGRRVDAGAGVVDQNVDSAEPLERRVEDAGEGLPDGMAALGVAADQRDVSPASASASAKPAPRPRFRP
jgi:hypothetical protein